jgi:hypothetical protein
MEEVSESEEKTERTKDPIEILVDRYVSDIVKSSKHIADLLPAVFYDRDQLKVGHLGRRLRLLSGYGFPATIRRYSKQENPPLYEVEPDSMNYRINKAYYQSHEFYQTQVYKKMYEFLVNKLKSQRHLDYP